MLPLPNAFNIASDNLRKAELSIVNDLKLTALNPASVERQLSKLGGVMSSSSNLSLKNIKELLQQANEEVEAAHQNYSIKSAGHKAALQIMQFEKDLYYGSSPTGRHLQKIREIIEINVEDIVNETN